MTVLKNNWVVAWLAHKNADICTHIFNYIK